MHSGDEYPYTSPIPVIGSGAGPGHPYTAPVPIVAPEPAVDPYTSSIPVVDTPAPCTTPIDVVPVAHPYTAPIDVVGAAAAAPASPVVPSSAPVAESYSSSIPVAGVPPLHAWQEAPHLQWSMQNMSAFLPTRPIPSGQRVTEFAAAPSDLTSLPVGHPFEERHATLGDVMAETYTDAWMVLKDGAIIDEHYFGAMTHRSLHLLMSVSKSLTTALAGALMDTGELSNDMLITNLVPAFEGSGYDGATVRNLIDMRTGVTFSESYLDPDAEVRLLEEAIGWAPRRNASTPGTLRDFLASLRADRPHGGRFDYKSCETDALAFGIEGATGRHTADLMSERLWKPMGAEASANVGVDSVGSGMFDGGVSAALRDLARFGYVMTHDGCALDGVRVLPSWWVADTYAGGIDSNEAFNESPDSTFMPGGMYRNGFWFPGTSRDVTLALGIHGQMIFMDRATGVVAAKVSSWPTPQNGERLRWTIHAFEAVSRALA